jgi:DNA mismatch repair protein MutL
MPTLDFDQNSSLNVPYDFKNKAAVVPPIEVDSNFNPFKTSNPSYSKPKESQWEGLYSGLNELESRSDSNSQEPLIEVSETTRVFQLFSKYIVCPLRTHMLVIDQSRAHQRVLYERFLNDITNKRGLSQQLLFPLEIELNPQQLEQYGHVEGALEMLGFQIVLAGQNKLNIKGAPKFCPSSKIEAVVESLLSDHDEESSLAHFSHADQVAKTMAKTLAIKYGEILEPREQQALLDDFFGCKETTVSPFNRQIFITLEKTEIEQKLN